MCLYKTTPLHTILRKCFLKIFSNIFLKKWSLSNKKESFLKKYAFLKIKIKITFFLKSFQKKKNFLLKKGNPKLICIQKCFSYILKKVVSKWCFFKKKKKSMLSKNVFYLVKFPFKEMFSPFFLKSYIYIYINIYLSKKKCFYHVKKCFFLKKMFQNSSSSFFKSENCVCVFFF